MDQTTVVFSSGKQVILQIESHYNTTSSILFSRDVSTDLPLYLRNWFVLQPLDGSSDIQLSEKYVQSFKEVIFPDQLQYNINITFDTPNLETYVSGIYQEIYGSKAKHIRL